MLAVFFLSGVCMTVTSRASPWGVAVTRWGRGRAGVQVADVWDVLQRQREIQRREAEEQPDADLEDTPDNAFPVALVRR